MENQKIRMRRIKILVTKNGGDFEQEGREREEN